MATSTETYVLKVRTKRKVMIKSTTCIAGWAGVEKSSLAGPVSGGAIASSSPVKKERDVLLENEFKDDSKKLPTLPLRSRPPIAASFHCCSPSPFCLSCFTAPSAAGAATTAAAAAAPSTAPAAAAEFASALLLLGGGRAVMVGNEDSRISSMLLLLLLVVAPTARGEEEDGADGAGGSISEVWIMDKPLLLSSDRDELLLLVLLPPPLLRRRKRDAMVLGPLASPRPGLWGMLGGM